MLGECARDIVGHIVEHGIGGEFVGKLFDDEEVTSGPTVWRHRLFRSGGESIAAREWTDLALGAQPVHNTASAIHGVEEVTERRNSDRNQNLLHFAQRLTPTSIGVEGRQQLRPFRMSCLGCVMKARTEYKIPR